MQTAKTQFFPKVSQRHLPQRRETLDPRKARYTLWFLVIVASIIGSFLLITPVIQFTSDDYLTITTFAVIGAWSLAALYLTMYERPFSLNCTHWVFILFFFSYAPLIQFLTQSFPGQADIGAFSALHLKTNGLIFLWCVLYSAAYHFTSVARPKRRRPAPSVGDAAKPNYVWLTLFCLTCMTLTLVTAGPSQLFSREVSSDITGSSGGEISSPVALITGTIGRSCPLGGLLLLLATGRRKQYGYYVALALVTISALVTNFPPAISRFLSGAIFISLICIAVRRRRMTGLWLLLVFWLGFIVAMPFLNLFRQNSVQDARVTSYQQQDLASVVTGGDFDAYMMLVATVSFGQKPDSLTWGRQLAGSLLFFVPRTMWPDKPISSGTLVVENTVLGFYNLSEPLPAEGYVNFGAFGVALFAAAFGWLLAASDKKYWTDRMRSDQARPGLITIAYPLLIGLIIFIMRGALLVSFAYSMGLVGACWVSLQVAYLGSHAKKSVKRLPPAALPRQSPAQHSSAFVRLRVPRPEPGD